VAELNDVLGAILRDVAQARVISDLFSRNVSVDYQQDDLLSAFPVPRVEIAQASVDLKFAVNKVEEKEFDPQAVIAARVAPFAVRLGRELYADLIETNPRGDEIEAVLAKKGLDFESQLPLLVEQTVKDNVSDLEAALAGRPEALVRKLQAELSGVVLGEPEVKEIMTRGTRLADVRERISVDAAASVGVLAREVAPTRTPEGEIDLESIPRATLTAAAGRLAARVYEDLVLANPRREELLAVAAERNLRIDKTLRETAERVILESPDELKVALEGQPDQLVERLESELTTSLLDAEEVKTAFTRRTRVTDIRTRVATTTASSLAAFAKELRAALAAAERQALAVDVAVTADELSSVPDTVVSQISVVSTIRNYEWVSTGEEGAPVRLQPE
jgi:hypothetical protein